MTNEVGQKAGNRGAAAARAVRNFSNAGCPPSPPFAMGYYTTYYTFGLPTFVLVVIGLYILLTGEFWNGRRMEHLVTPFSVALRRQW